MMRWRARALPHARRDEEGVRDAGFALLDVLVALAVLAAILSFLPQALLTARQSIHAADERLEMRLVADRILQELVADGIAPGTRGGRIDGHEWRSVTHIRDTAARSGVSDEEHPGQIYETRCSIRSPDNRLFSFDRLTMGLTS